MSKVVKIWQHVTFSDSWKNADTRVLDSLKPSWDALITNDPHFIESSRYKDFVESLKRRHAIETGIIEGLYDIDDGVTETLIKDGIVESYLGHTDATMTTKEIYKILKDHESAIDFVFEIVNKKRGLSTSFIKELHALVLNNQRVTTAKDSLGKYVSIEVIKGKWKQHPNNPVRDDGTLHEYCPPEHVDSEMDQLLRLYEDASKKNINPIVIAAWFHHAFTTIHPFQDGNGRMARLLTSAILIKK